MAKVIMTCGKICSGKSTYAQKLSKEYNAVILSVDEITLALFGQDVGDKHDDYVARAEKYFFEKSVEIVNVGINVILDWGFWTREERNQARDFYNSHNIKNEFHYIDISEKTWKERIQHRNSMVLSNKTNAYYVDSGLVEKFNSFFEKPYPDEIDVWNTL